MQVIAVPARIDSLDVVLEFIGHGMRQAGMNSRQQNSINIAAEEIFVNIAGYAYPEGDGEIIVCLPNSRPGVFDVEFVDRGTPFDPLAKKDPDTSLSAEDREIGGLGILMVKKLMDNVQYRYEDGKNILTIELLNS